MQCIITENNLIRLTQFDNTKKIAHDSYIVRGEENLKLRHGGASQRQASATNQHVIYFCVLSKQSSNIYSPRQAFKITIEDNVVL